MLRENVFVGSRLRWKLYLANAILQLWWMTVFCILWITNIRHYRDTWLRECRGSAFGFRLKRCVRFSGAGHLSRCARSRQPRRRLTVSHPRSINIGNLIRELWPRHSTDIPMFHRMTDRTSQRARNVQTLLPTRGTRNANALPVGDRESRWDARGVTSCENSKRPDAARRPLRVAFFYARDSAKLSRPAGAPRSLRSFNTRAEIYKPTEKFDSKINNDIKSSGGGEI